MVVDGARGLPTVPCPRRGTGRILPPGCSLAPSAAPLPIPVIAPPLSDRTEGNFGGQLLLAARCLTASSIPPFPSHQQHHEKPELRSKTPLRALTHAAPLLPSAPSANPKTCFLLILPQDGDPGAGEHPPFLPPSLPRPPPCPSTYQPGQDAAAALVRAAPGEGSPAEEGEERGAEPQPAGGPSQEDGGRAPPPAPEPQPLPAAPGAPHRGVRPPAPAPQRIPPASGCRPRWV